MVLVAGDRRRDRRGRRIGCPPGWTGWHSSPWCWPRVWLIVRYIRWVSTSLVVTTCRLIRRTRGAVDRNDREIPLRRLTDISYHQSLFERVIGAGDVLLESAGREGQEVFPDLPRPARIQQAIAVQLDRPAPSDGPAARHRRVAMAGRYPAQIEQLDALRRRGLITDAEFQAKKTQLLDRL